jgi:glycosyltransferase involved in cell wall biosynthesis
MPPRVSLLASTYRSRRFLEAWLRSLESQTVWPQAELVVVANDPEPDEQRLLGEFAARHAQVRLLEVARESLYRSWNRAIAEASAPVLAIANVDDLRTPGGLETQVAAMEADPQALFCYGAFTISRRFPPPPGDGRLVPAEPFDREAFTRGMRLGPFFVWRNTGEPATTWFDEQLRVGGDMDLAVRLALHGRGIPVSESLGVYYDGSTGLSTTGDVQPIERTVLELRYGIYEDIDYRYIADAAHYVVPRVLMPDGTWTPVADLVPGYEELVAARRDRWRRRAPQRWSRALRAARTLARDLP